MSGCIRCGTPPDYEFHVLSVQTLHIRDFNGERVVQALGGFEKFGVCYRCAAERLNETLNIKRSAVKALPFIMIFVAGCIVSVIPNIAAPVKMPAAAAIFCGIVGAFTTVQKALCRKKLYSVLPENDALAKCAWECALTAAPHKYEDNDITYIPVNADSLAASPQMLAQQYDLLPAIADQACSRLRSELSFQQSSLLQEKN